MKRVILALVLVLIVGFAAAAQTIGENFEGGGAVVGGDGSFYSNLDGYWSLSFNPWAEWLASDGVAIGSGFATYVNSEETFRIGVSPYHRTTSGTTPKPNRAPLTKSYSTRR